MARPKFNLVVTDKTDNQRYYIGAAWQATRGKDGPEIPGCFNLTLGNKSEQQACEAYIVVQPRGGQKFKVSLDTHYIAIWENNPKGGGSAGSSADADDDF